MLMLRFVAASEAGRRPSLEYTPCAVLWYGADASNQALVTSVVTRSTRVASEPDGETSVKMIGATAGMMTSIGALPVSRLKLMAGLLYTTEAAMSRGTDNKAKARRMRTSVQGWAY